MNIKSKYRVHLPRSWNDELLSATLNWDMQSKFRSKKIEGKENLSQEHICNVTLMSTKLPIE